MKVTSKPLAFTLISLIFAIIIIGVYLQVLWTDWAITKIFNKDFNDFKIFACICVVEMLAPKSLQGLTTIILILMTLYIFLTA